VAVAHLLGSPVGSRILPSRLPPDPSTVPACSSSDEDYSVGPANAEVVLVAVNTNEEARRPRRPGSPTIRVDGRDLFPIPVRGDWRPRYLVYAKPEG
jgi:hypothetical protein